LQIAASGVGNEQNGSKFFGVSITVLTDIVNKEASGEI
jgi:hypothetical protein